MAGVGGGGSVGTLGLFGGWADALCYPHCPSQLRLLGLGHSVLLLPEPARLQAQVSVCACSCICTWGEEMYVKMCACR